MLKNGPFLSNRLFKKGTFLEKSVFIFLLSYFCTLFAKNGTLSCQRFIAKYVGVQTTWENEIWSLKTRETALLITSFNV